MSAQNEKPKILILGATGFIGSNLLKELKRKKIKSRILTRNKKKLRPSKYIEIIEGNIFNINKELFSGINVIYYFLHALDYENSDKQLIELETKQIESTLKHLTKDQRLIYLGGLGNNNSNHLNSRHKVGQIIRKRHQNSIEIQTSLVIGNGSASYELIKKIIYNFPFIITAKWANSLCSPIHINDLIKVLIDLKDFKLQKSEILKIGGKVAYTYVDLLNLYAKSQKVERYNISIPNFPIEIVLVAINLILNDDFIIAKNLLGSVNIPTNVTEEMINPIFNYKLKNFKSYEEAIKIEEKKLKENPYKENFNFTFNLQELNNLNIFPFKFAQLKKMKRFTDFKFQYKKNKNKFSIVLNYKGIQKNFLISRESFNLKLFQEIFKTFD